MAALAKPSTHDCKLSMINFCVCYTTLAHFICVFYAKMWFMIEIASIFYAEFEIPWPNSLTSIKRRWLMIGKCGFVQQTKPKIHRTWINEKSKKHHFWFSQKTKYRVRHSYLFKMNTHINRWCSSVYFLEFCLRLYRDDWLIFHFNSIDAHKLKCQRMLRATLFFFFSLNHLSFRLVVFVAVRTAEPGCEWVLWFLMFWHAFFLCHLNGRKKQNNRMNLKWFIGH